MIGPDNSVLGGLIGAMTVLAANWGVSRIAINSPRFERAIEGVPTVLIHNGKLVERNIRKETISKEDLMSNLRTQGCFNLAEVETAVLEPSGKISLMKKEHPRTTEATGRQTPPAPESPR